MYQSNEIIDEVVLEAYEQGIQKSKNAEDLRLAMFDTPKNQGKIKPEDAPPVLGIELRNIKQRRLRVPEVHKLPEI